MESDYLFDRFHEDILCIAILHIHYGFAMKKLKKVYLRRSWQIIHFSLCLLVF